MIFKTYYYFQTIAECRNITKAAKALYVSQPSLSKYLKRLEAALGVELINHNSSPLELTYAGARYLDHLKQVYQLEKQLQNDFAKQGSQLFSIVRVGFTPWHALSLFPIIFKSFKQRYANVRIELHELYSEKLIKMVLTEQIDFCIFMQPYDIVNLKRDILMQQKIVVAISRNNPILLNLKIVNDREHYPVIDVTDLRNMPLILPKQSHVFSQYVYSFLELKEVYMPIEIEPENFATTLNLVSENLGIAFVLENKDFFKRYEDDIVFFYLEDLKVSDVCIVYKSLDNLSNQAINLIEHIKRIFMNK